LCEKEIREYISNLSIKIKKISFIGFSLGGVIIRNTLKYLKEFKHKFFFFLSLSSPHLGIAF